MQKDLTVSGNKGNEICKDNNDGSLWEEYQLNACSIRHYLRQTNNCLILVRRHFQSVWAVRVNS